VDHGWSEMMSGLLSIILQNPTLPKSEMMLSQDDVRLAYEMIKLYMDAF
jgi:hypothetical protein